MTRVCHIFHEMLSVSPHLELLVLLKQRRGGADTKDQVGKGVKPTVKNGMQSQVLASVSTKNSVLAHAAAAVAGSATMNNIQKQRDPKRNLMKEFNEELRGSSLGRAAAKARLKKYKKRRSMIRRQLMTQMMMKAALNLILRNHSLRVFWNVTSVLPILILSMSSKRNC